MGIESNVSLMVASLDLQLVKLLRDAIRTADLHGQLTAPPPAAVAPGGCVRRTIEPAAVYEPRRHIHPEPHGVPTGLGTGGAQPRPLRPLVRDVRGARDGVVEVADRAAMEGAAVGKPALPAAES